MSDLELENAEIGEPETGEGAENPPTETPDPQDREGDVFVSIGDPTEEELSAVEAEEEEIRSAPQWVRDVRKTNREQSKTIRNLEEKIKVLEGKTQSKETQLALGKKPSLDDEGIDFDEEKYEQAMTDYLGRKNAVEKQKRQLEEAEQAQKQAWDEKLQSYQTKKQALRVRDYDDAENNVRSSLNVTQQGIIIQGAENPALIVYALGKRPEKLKELSAITDPVKFAFAVAAIQKDLKVTQRKPATKPEISPSNTGNINSSVDSTLEKLRADAAKTGDFSKVLAYKQQKKQKE